MSIRETQKRVHEISVSKGWWEKPAIIVHKSGEHEIDFDQIAVKLAMIHCEVSECVEAIRDGSIDTYYRPGSAKPEGLGIELADVVIRCMDLAGACNIDLQAVIALKYAYNVTRPHRHGGRKL